MSKWGTQIEVLGSPDHGCGTVCQVNCDSKTFVSPSLSGYLRHFCSLRLGALWLLCFNGAGYKHSYLLTYLHPVLTIYSCRLRVFSYWWVRPGEVVDVNKHWVLRHVKVIAVYQLLHQVTVERCYQSATSATTSLSHSYFYLIMFPSGLYQNGPWTKTAHKFSICPKRPMARSKTAHSYI